MMARLRPLRADETADTVRRAAVSFGDSEDGTAAERWARRIERGELWGLEEDGHVVAHARLIPAQHWFGGRLVDTLDVASVSVPPEHRGRGIGRELMRQAIIHGSRKRAGLSLLFPATTRMYRSSGWELAGALARYRVDARKVPAIGPAMRPADRDGDWAAIQACHRLAASRRSAPAVRLSERWETLAASDYLYVLDTEDASGTVDAYVLVNHRRAAGDWQYSLAIGDWAAVTPRGLQAVIGFVGRHGTFGKDATFTDAVPDTWSSFLPEQDVERAGGLYWMARGLHLPTAISQRGFPAAVSATVTLRVDDPVLPAELCGPFRLEVSGGRGRLAATADAAVTIAAGGVGPLFTGFRNASDLAVTGLLRGPQKSLEALSACFAAPMPMLYDFF